jgi:hypothetical protein
MTFELEADGVHFWCSSPVWTQKLVEKGARLVDESQAEHLRRAIGSPEPSPAPSPQRRTGSVA